VAFFVKAVVRDNECRAALQALGLPTETQRFAIVDAYAASDVQKGVTGVDMKQDYVKAVGGALAAAKLLPQASDYSKLLDKVHEMATVLACAKKSKVTLKRTAKTAGRLKRLAIPLSSNYEQWYHRAESDNYAVHPVCRIDPRKCTTVFSNVTATVQPAIKAVRDTMLYFVHTYSNSNCRTARWSE
jgi:hypothetical protein